MSSQQRGIIILPPAESSQTKEGEGQLLLLLLTPLMVHCHINSLSRDLSNLSMWLSQSPSTYSTANDCRRVGGDWQPAAVMWMHV